MGSLATMYIGLTFMKNDDYNNSSDGDDTLDDLEKEELNNNTKKLSK